MSVVNLDAVLTNSELDFLNDAATSCFDAQNLSSLHDMVGGGGSEVNARGAHDLGQAVALNG